MPAHRVSLKIDRGATFKWSGVWSTGPDCGDKTPVDMTGCTADMQIRNDQDDLLYTMPPGSIVLGADGKIEFEISDEDTSNFGWEEGVYDMFINFPDGTRDRRLSGTVIVNPRVTKP